MPASERKIFISYRRDETDFVAGWIYERLVRQFGRERVFKDVDSIALGDDFVRAVTNAVSASDVVLVLIGKQWLGIVDKNNNRRLDDPFDFVRLEIQAALSRNIRMIPILINGAQMPNELELPADIRGLAYRQALELNSRQFESDADRLVEAVQGKTWEERAQQDASTQRVVAPVRSRSSRGRTAAVISVVVLALIVVILSIFLVNRLINTAAAPTVPATGVDLTAAETSLGTVVTNDGFTLYRFDRDQVNPSKSNCVGDCATTWPPLLTDGAPVLDGIDPALVGTVDRSDGAKQLTLNGWPLYRYSKDTAALDTKGEGVGGTWHAIGVDGEPATGTKPSPNKKTPTPTKSSKPSPSESTGPSPITSITPAPPT